jgi:hypothetical protein
MSEKRKPELVFDAYYQGNNRSTRSKIIKIELFPASQWADRVPVFGKGKSIGLSAWELRGDVYRVRVNGKWYKPKTGKQTLTISEFFSVFRRSIIAARKSERKKDRKAKR